MRSKDLVLLRNRAILLRFKALKKEHQHNRFILNKMKYEFYLSDRTLEGIIFSTKEREQHGISLGDE